MFSVPISQPGPVMPWIVAEAFRRTGARRFRHVDGPRASRRCLRGFLFQPQLFQSRHLESLGLDFGSFGELRLGLSKLGWDQDTENGRLAERLAGFEPMQSLDQKEAVSVEPNGNGSLLSDVQHTFRDLRDGLGLDGLLLLRGNEDLLDREAFRFGHNLTLVLAGPSEPMPVGLESRGDGLDSKGNSARRIG